MSIVHVFRRDMRAALPARKTTQAAGYDLSAYLDAPLVVKPLQTVVIPTGLFLALPVNSVGLVCSRSGKALSGLFVTNGPGVIDSDYRGEVKVILTYVVEADAKPYTINPGDAIAQLVILTAATLMHPLFLDVPYDALPPANSTRMGGFGSTGS